MIEVASTTISVIDTIVKKCQEIKALPEDCKSCANVLKRLSPVVKEIETQLTTHEHRSLFEELNGSLYDVEEVIDYIATHPKYTKVFSSTYLEKLHNALGTVDKWIGRIQTVGLSITNQSQTILSGLTQDVKGFITVIHKEFGEVKAKLDSLQHQLESGSLDGKLSDILGHLDGKLSDILGLLEDVPVLEKDGRKEKNPRFQDFIVEEELRTIRMMESMAAKIAGIPKPLLCPITLDVMKVPVLNTQSGNTYDEKTLRRHMAQCVEQGQPITDPLTREKFDPEKHLVRNRAIEAMIAEWKAEHMNEDVLGSSTGNGDLVEEASEKSPMNEGSSEAVAFNKFKSWFIEEPQFSAELAEHYVRLLGTKGISGVDRLQRMLNREKTLLTDWDIDPIDAEDILEKLFPRKAETTKVVSVPFTKNPVASSAVTATVAQRASKGRTEEPSKASPVPLAKNSVASRAVTTIAKETFSGAVEHTLRGHTHSVLTVIELSNGQLASGSWDNTIKLWDIESEKCVATLTGHTNTVFSVIELSNGQLASGSADNTIKLWDIESEKCVATLTGHTNCVLSVIELSNGQLASGSDDSTIKLWS